MIAGIQYLRFVAAFMVLLGHALMEAHQQGVLNDSAHHATDKFPWGAGVDIFFVISGFIIHRASAKLAPGKRSTGDFLFKRALRIVPLYWTFTALMLAAIWIAPDHIKAGAPDITQVLKSLFFIPYSLDRAEIRPILAQGWTINYEMFFYSLAAAALMVPNPVRTKTLVALVLIAFGTGAAFKGNGVFFDFLGQSVMLEFLLGILLSVYSRTLLAMRATIRITLALSGFVTLYAIGSSQDLPRVICEGIAATMIVAAFMSHGFGEGKFSRGLVYLGNASFVLYLSHPFTINAVDLALRKLPALPAPAWIAIAITAALGAAVAIYATLEVPMNNKLKRLAMSSNQTQVVAAV